MSTFPGLYVAGSFWADLDDGKRGSTSSLFKLRPAQREVVLSFLKSTAECLEEHEYICDIYFSLPI